MNEKLKKELRDQSAHFSIGCATVLVLSFFMPVWAAGIAVFGVALFREKAQHPDKKLTELGSGSRLDMAFWSLGIALAVGLKLGGVL